MLLPFLSDRVPSKKLGMPWTSGLDTASEGEEGGGGGGGGGGRGSVVVGTGSRKMVHSHGRGLRRPHVDHLWLLKREGGREERERRQGREMEERERRERERRERGRRREREEAGKREEEGGKREGGEGGKEERGREGGKREGGEERRRRQGREGGKREGGEEGGGGRSDPSNHSILEPYLCKGIPQLQSVQDDLVVIPINNVLHPNKQTNKQTNTGIYEAVSGAVMSVLELQS